MSFTNQFAPYSQNCYQPEIINPLKVPFMNSVDLNNDSKYKSPMSRTFQNENKYYINNFNNNENFVNKNSNKSTSKKSNDFALAWTCVQRDDGTFYCPLRGDKY